jgi:hypothetical protein
VFQIRILLVPAVFVVTLGVLGCGKQDEPKPMVAAPPPAGVVAPAPAPSAAAPAPAPQLAAAPAPAQPAAPAQNGLSGQEYSQNPNLRCDVLEVRRVSGGALLIKWRLFRPAAAGGLIAQADDKKIFHNWGWANVYFTDPAENKKYSGLKDSAGEWIGQGIGRDYGAGDQQVVWMKFPAPPATSTKIAFVFPGFPPFDDLPIAQ